VTGRCGCDRGCRCALGSTPPDELAAIIKSKAPTPKQRSPPGGRARQADFGLGYALASSKLGDRVEQPLGDDVPPEWRHDRQLTDREDAAEPETGPHDVGIKRPTMQRLACSATIMPVGQDFSWFSLTKSDA
jgi:hypothetical protein